MLYIYKVMYAPPSSSSIHTHTIISGRGVGDWLENYVCMYIDKPLMGREDGEGEGAVEEVPTHQEPNTHGMSTPTTVVKLEFMVIYI